MALPSGTDPRTGTPLRRNVFLPWCPVSSLSWPACAGAFLVPGRWFFGPAPSGSCLFLFRLMFLSTGRGRHVPAPGGRDVGSSAGAPTQEPVQGADPRTGFFRYHLCTTFLRTSLCLTCSFPCTLLFIFRVCFGHCSGYLRHQQFHTQWYKTSPQVLSGFCRSPGEAQADLDGGRRSRWSLLSLFKGTEQRVFRWLSLSKHL